MVGITFSGNFMYFIQTYLGCYHSENDYSILVGPGPPGTPEFRKGTKRVNPNAKGFKNTSKKDLNEE